MSQKTIRKWAIFWTLFIGIGAIVGTAMFFIDPSGKRWGMDILLPAFQILPFADIFFRNFIFPGIALFLVNGVSNGIAFLLLLRKSRYGGIATMTCGIVLIIWIIIQLVILPFNIPSTLFLFIGVAETFTGYKLWKREASASQKG